MKNSPGENGNLSDSSLFKARIREADLASQEKLQEIQGAADELARQAIIDKLKQAEVEHEKLKLKLEQEAYDRVEDILSHVELSAAENEDNFTSGIDGLLAKLFKFFNFMDSELGVETDPQVYRMIKKREEQEKEAWVATVIKFLRDKFNKLIKAIFSRDLSFQQKIDKEIKELYEKLFSGSLSPEEEVAILERLEALRDLKLKLQIFVVGSVIAMFSELFSVELTASVETTKEEGKEKASAKEATKEVRENLEIKVDAKEKPQLKYDVIPALDAESWLKKPITLTKQELDLLPKPLKNLMHPIHKDDMNKGNSVVPKQEVKEKQGQENKQARPERKKKVHSPKPVEQKHEAGGPRFYLVDEEKSYVAEDRNLSSTISDVSGRKYKPASKQKGRFASSRESCLSGDASGVDKKGTNSTDKKKVLCAKLAEKVTQREKSAASVKHDYPIDHFQIPAETNGKSHASDRNEPQQSSMNNAQENPKSKFTDVVKERIGQAEGRASLRGR